MENGVGARGRLPGPARQRGANTENGLIESSGLGPALWNPDLQVIYYDAGLPSFDCRTYPAVGTC